MLVVLVGPPGTGKTVVAVQDYSMSTLKEYNHIYHNIPGFDDSKVFRISRHLNLDAFKLEGLLHYYPTDTDAEIDAFLKLIPTVPEHSLIIMDEAQNLIGARDWASERNKKFFEYATKHRHHKHNLLVVTQHEDNIDGTIRRIANGLVVLRRLESLGWFARNYVSRKSYDSFQTRNQTPLGQDYFKYNKAVFSFYDSYNNKGSGKEKRKVASIWFNGKLIVIVIILIFCLTRFSAFFDMVGFTGKKKPAANAVQQARQPVQPSDFIGDYEDYYCAFDGLYVLRPGGKIDTLSTRGVPVTVCPRLNYAPPPKPKGVPQ